MGTEEPQEKRIRRISGSKVVHWINEALATIADPVCLRFQSQVTRTQIHNVYLVLKANNAFTDQDKLEVEFHEVMRQLLQIEIFDLLKKLHWAARCQNRESARALFQKMLFLRDTIESHIKAVLEYTLPSEVDIINSFGISFLNCINKNSLDVTLVKDAQTLESVMVQALHSFFNLCLSHDGYVSPNVQSRIHSFVSHLRHSLHFYVLDLQQKAS